MGRTHAERLQADGRGEIVALYDFDRRVAEQFARDAAPQAVVFDDLRILLSAETVQAAIICTPTTAHFAQASACLEKGLDVLCEKPLAATRKEIADLVELARRPAPKLMVAYQRRFWSIYRTLRREILSRRWGGVRAVLSHNAENWLQVYGGTWRDDPIANFGGFVGDAGSHKIDAIFYTTGLLPVEVFARCDHCGSRVEVTASVSALLTGRVPLTIDFIGNAQHFGEHLHIHCDEADLIVQDNALWIAHGERIERFESLEPETNPVSGFLDLICEGGENPAPAACALPVFEFTQAVLDSSRTGLNQLVSQV